MNELKQNSKRLWALMFMMCSFLISFAQQAVVTGEVKDASNEPVIGATVQVKNAGGGAITDIDGNFRLSVPDVKNAILVVSFIGYETQEIPLNGKKQVKVVLQEQFNELAEVTVVAYGVQKKETLTGAISSVKTDELLVSPNASVANSLAGKITGLSSVQGKIRRSSFVVSVH